MDLCCKYVEVQKLTTTTTTTTTTTSASVVSSHKDMFSHNIIPAVLVSDNRPQLDFKNMKKFAYSYNFHN